MSRPRGEFVEFHALSVLKSSVSNQVEAFWAASTREQFRRARRACVSTVMW